MSGEGSRSRNPTPPVGRPSSTPTLPQLTTHPEPPTPPKDEPKPVPLTQSQPQVTNSERAPAEQLHGPCAPPATFTPPAHLSKAIKGLTDEEASILGRELEAPPLDSIRPSSPPESLPLAPPIGTDTEATDPISKETWVDAAPEMVSAVPPAMPGLAPPSAYLLSTAFSPTAAAVAPAAVLAPPSGLTPPTQGVAVVNVVQTLRPCLGTESKDNSLRAAGETEALFDGTSDQRLLSNSRKSPVLVQAASTAPKTWKKPKETTPVGESLVKENQELLTGEESGNKAVPRELDNQRIPSPAPEGSQETPLSDKNGKQEAEPLRNGAEHASETESSDSGVNSGDKETPLVAPNYVYQEESDRKRRYHRDFLLSLQFMPACVQKLEGLPHIAGVVLDKINQSKFPMQSSDSRMISQGPDFTPAFTDFGRPSLEGRGATLLDGGLQRPRPQKIITNKSVNDEVQLNKAENAWKPRRKREVGAEDSESQKTQELFGKVRSILNKMTPEMFNKLMKQMADLTIDTEERLKGVISLVFEKAINEPRFSVVYGNMCRSLSTLRVPKADKRNETVNFRKLLLNHCRKEFEKDKVEDIFQRKQKELESAVSASEQECLQEELEEAKEKAQRRSLGNVKLIGELFKVKMLKEGIMHDCVVKLLKNHSKESLECLCQLLNTIGEKLDIMKAKPRMDQYFNQMVKIVKERKTLPRIRFMLQDVIDLRLRNWVPRRVDQGP